MGDAQPAVCLLCDQTIDPDDVLVLKERAIEGFKKLSLEKKDKKHTAMASKKTLKIHKSCNVTYRRSCDKPNNKEIPKENKVENRRLFAAAREIDLDECCFLCGEDASDNYIKNISRHKTSKFKNNIVHFVRQSETASTSLQYVDKCMKPDLFVRLIKTRIQNVDLIGKQYHHACKLKLYQKQRLSSGVEG